MQSSMSIVNGIVNDISSSVSDYTNSLDSCDVVNREYMIPHIDNQSWKWEEELETFLHKNKTRTVPLVPFMVATSQTELRCNNDNKIEFSEFKQILIEMNDIGSNWNECNQWTVSNFDVNIYKKYI